MDTNEIIAFFLLGAPLEPHCSGGSRGAKSLLPLWCYHYGTELFAWWLQVKRCDSSTFCLRCWRIQTWPIVSPGCQRLPASSASPPRTRNRWRRSGARERATRSPWLTRRCPAPSGTTGVLGRSSRWRRSSPTSSVKTRCCYCRGAIEEARFWVVLLVSYRTLKLFLLGALTLIYDAILFESCI